MFVTPKPNIGAMLQLRDSEGSRRIFCEVTSTFDTSTLFCLTREGTNVLGVMYVVNSTTDCPSSQLDRVLYDILANSHVYVKI